MLPAEVDAGNISTFLGEPCSPIDSYSPKNPPIPIAARKLEGANMPKKLKKGPAVVPPLSIALQKFSPQGVPEVVSRMIHEEGEVREYEGLLINTKARQHWFIIPPEERVQPLDIPFAMNGARNELARRQVKSRPIPPSKETLDKFFDKYPQIRRHPQSDLVIHEAQELAFMAGWSWIRQILVDSGDNDEIAVPTDDETQPLCFQEVYLNDYGVVYDRKVTEFDRKVGQTCGQVDIYGMLLDAQGVIIDFGSLDERKELQTLRQYQGMRAVIQESNHGKVPPITVLIGEYFRDGDGVNVVHLKKPEQYSPDVLFSQDLPSQHNFYEVSSSAAD